MKKKLMIVLMVAMTVTAMAQSHVEAAFDALKDSKLAKAERINSTFSSDDRREGLLEIYRFKADRQVLPLVNRLIDAFETDSHDAYNYVSHEAGSKLLQYAVFYDRENSVQIGKDKSCNYVLINVPDPQDNNYRFCYVVEWKEVDGGKEGRAIKTYAPKPRSTNKLFAKRDGGPLTINIGGDTTIMVDIDSLIDLSGLGKLKDEDYLKGLEKLKGLSGMEILGKLGSVDVEELKNQIIVLSGDSDRSVPTDDVEWLTSFNHYRNAFKRAAARESSAAASYATSILKLCKNVKAASLTDGELALCRKSIKEMQKLTKDDFVKGLLDEAMNYLK